jgi:ABC-type amino acid transport substrate-binding protein
MKKGLLGLIIIAVIAIVGVKSLGTKEKVEGITIGTSGSYKPYTFQDDQGNLQGFEIDVWSEVSKRTGIEVAYETSAFSGLFGMLDTGKINTIANQITVTQARQEKYLFTESYVFYGAQLVVKEGNNEVYDFETLKGKKVGVSLGSNYEEMLRKFDTNNEIEIITYESYIGSLQDVALGRIDAVLNDKLAGLTAIKESGLALQLGGEPVKKMRNAFPFVNNEENKELIATLNEAILSMHADGTFEEISLKWFPVDITAK